MNRREGALSPTEKLHSAVISLDVDQVRLLLDKGALPSQLVNHTTALHLAVSKPSNEINEKKALAILKMLLDEGGDINQMASYRTVMNLAGHNSFWAAVLLIASSKSSDAKDNGHYGSALLDVIRFCDDEAFSHVLLDKLIEQGAKANRHSGFDGYTALHWAVQKGKASVLRKLLVKFPEEYLRKSVATDAHPDSVTPIRMAFDLHESYDIPRPTEAQKLAKKKAWECLCAIAEVAYLPIIEGRQATWPKELQNEKFIIFKYICSFTPEKKWVAILNGLDKTHPLRKLNDAQNGFLRSIGNTDTVVLYKAEKKRMEEQGVPASLASQQPTIPASAPLDISPQLYRSAPRVITNYVNTVSSARSADESEVAPMFSYTPLFNYSPQASRSPLHQEPEQEPAPEIAVKLSESSSESDELSSQEDHPNVFPSTSPEDFLAELSGRRSSRSHSHGAEDDAIKGPSRF